MNRAQQIYQEAANEHSVSQETAFIKGANWADKHLYDKWHKSSDEQPDGKHAVLTYDGEHFTVEKYVKVTAPYWVYVHELITLNIN